MKTAEARKRIIQACSTGLKPKPFINAMIPTEVTMKNKEFISGVLYAVQELILIFDQPTMAEEIMRGAGSEDDFIKAQKPTEHETRKMNKAIRNAFN